MELVHILRTIPNKHSLPASFRAGVLSKSFNTKLILHAVLSFSASRCTSNHANLDDVSSSVPRSHAHTDALRRASSDNFKTLWNEYGIVSDVIVRFPWIGRYPLINICNHWQPFTTHFPRADIHELLAPDLLHQIIKGTFKDHLVTWVMNYVAAEHGKSVANRILADIDRR
jgi:hypothetical protein